MQKLVQLSGRERVGALIKIRKGNVHHISLQEPRAGDIFPARSFSASMTLGMLQEQTVVGG